MKNRVNIYIITATLFHTLFYGFLSFDMYVVTFTPVHQIYINLLLLTFLLLGEVWIWKKIKHTILQSKSRYTVVNTLTQKQWYKNTIRTSDIVFLLFIIFSGKLPDLLLVAAIGIYLGSVFVYFWQQREKLVL